MKSNGYTPETRQLIEPTVTVTEIPLRHVNTWINMSLFSPGIIDLADSSWGQPIGASTTFRVFAMPGTYDVGLSFRFDKDDWRGTAYYSAPRKNITGGTNTIPFSAFSPVPQMSVTVTGIPALYDTLISASASLSLPSTETKIADSYKFSSPFTTLTILSQLTMPLFHLTRWPLELPFNRPETYDILWRFNFLSDGDWVQAIYTISSQSLTSGNTTIPFEELTPVKQVKILS